MELIIPEMTPKERAAAYARGETVDRQPTNLSANETCPPMYGYKISDYYFSADIMVDVETRLANDFHADNMGIGLGLRTVVEALGTKLHVSDYNVSYIEAPALNSFDELGKLHLVNIDKDGRFPIICEATERLLDRFGEVRGIGSGLAGPLTTASGLIGTEKLLKAMVKDKENAHKLMQISTDIVVNVCKDMNKKLGIKFMLSEPMASQDILGPRQFKEFFLPYLKQSVDRMNEFQGGTGIHICGHTSKRWEDVVNAGINSFWVDNCESLKDLKEQHGDRIALSGNVKPVDVLKNGSPDDIREAIKNCLIDAADNPMGYRMCPGCTTPAMTSRENMIAFMNAATELGRNAKKGTIPEGVRKYI